MAKINIVHVIFMMKVGGAENMLADLVNEQAKKANVYIIIVNSQFDRALMDRILPNVTIFNVGREVGSRNPFVLLKIWLWLFRHKVDVIHCHQHNLVNMLPFWKNKSVVTIHSLGVQVQNLKKYKKVFSISDAVMNDLLRRGGIQSTVIYNGVKAPIIRQKDLNGFNTSPSFRIVQVSRLIHEVKGQHLAIEAIHKLKNLGYQNVQLYFIGTGPSLSFLKKLITKYDLEQNIFFLGAKERGWIYENLNQFDLLLQPSLNEGFGLTIVEGLAAGLPVIASNIDGPAEILKDIPAGFLFDINKDNDLVYTIQKVMELTKLNEIQEQCDLSRKLVCQKYCIDLTVSNYLKNYPVLGSSLAVA
jgi:glycosyltransferase involved in cell wall biosynthesis